MGSITSAFTLNLVTELAAYIDADGCSEKLEELLVVVLFFPYNTLLRPDVASTPL